MDMTYSMYKPDFRFFKAKTTTSICWLEAPSPSDTNFTNFVINKSKSHKFNFFLNSCKTENVDFRLKYVTPFRKRYSFYF